MNKDDKMTPYFNSRVARFWEDVFHDADYDGIIFICAKTQDEKFYTVRKLARHELLDYLKTFEISPDLDYYYSINQFIKKKGGISRRGSNFFAACGTVIDVDVHDRGLTKKHIQKELSAYKGKLDTLISMGEAFPYHYCVKTGRGLQFVYIYNRCINYKLEVMHKRIQELMLRQHSKVLADNPDIHARLDSGAATKLSGVYRMPGTYNTKAHSRVTLTRTGYAYLDTSKIIDAFGFFDEPPFPQDSAYRINPKFKRTSHKKISHCRKMVNAIYQYQQDRHAYRQNPGHENRHCTCFALIHFLLATMTYEETIGAIFKFNNNFYVPLPEKRLKSMVDYAYQNWTDESKYRMRYLRTSTVLDLLNLEDGEYGIHDTREERLKREKERAVRRKEKAGRNKKICELYLEGIPCSEIAGQAHCSKRTVQRVVRRYRSEVDALNHPECPETGTRDKNT